MKKLFDLVELVSNTEDAVVLKVKPGSEVDLICLGCFDGDETMLRLTKGTTITCTVWTNKGSNFSWHWGDSGHTLVSDNMTKKGRAIQHCIEDYFDIVVYGSRESIRKNMRATKHEHIIQLWENSGCRAGCGCRKDDEFYRLFETMEIALTHFRALGYTYRLRETKRNCCNSLTYYYIITK